MSAIELICDEKNLCGEGPLWDARSGRLIWNDCASSLLFEYWPGEQRHRTIGRGLMIAGEALNHDGRLVVCGATGLHLWKEQDQFVTLASQHEGEVLVFNDMIAGPDGGVYAGTLYWDERGMTKHGKLYHISPAGKIQIVDDRLELANGLGFSPDGRTLYFADSAARTIWAYDVDRRDGSLRNKRIFVRVGDDEGIPDGLTVDAEGFVYSAQWYGGQVVRYDPDGHVQRRIKLPVTQVSSVAFGGAELCELYVTTAADPWPSALRPRGFDTSAPSGGGLFRIRVETPGVNEHIARLRTNEPGN